MRIAYCTNVRLPNERAHGYQIAHVTDALAKLGHEVTVFHPYRSNEIKLDPVSYYGIRSNVQFKQLGSVDGIAAWWAPGVLGLKVTTALFARLLKKELKNGNFDLLYTRTPELLGTLVSINKPVIVELHRIPRLWRGRFARFARKCRLVVALTSPMRTALIEMGISSVPVIAEGDAVDLALFADQTTKPEARAAFELPQNTPLIGFAGQLESMGLSKGVPELLEALAILKKRGLEFHAVLAGGPEEVKLKFQKSLSAELKPHVTFTGNLHQQRVPTLLAACDVLVYPAPASNDPFYTRDTSPLKIFEYMAAGQPIVTADLPTIRDVLTDAQATFCPPGNAEALADAIRAVLADLEGSAAKARIARAEVEKYTWEKRMGRILQAAGIP